VLCTLAQDTDRPVQETQFQLLKCPHRSACLRVWVVGLSGLTPVSNVSRNVLPGVPEFHA